jgi:aerobic carbon-monoxide dehydrogenase medium subunit
MFSPSFDYYRAGSVAEAGDLLRKHPGAKLLAGGHSLIPLLKLRLASPPAVIDIGRIRDLKGITRKDGVVRIGALTTHAEIAASSVVREQCPALAEAAQLVGDPAVRNRGTIGGNVAHADPASDLPTVLTALGATFQIASSGKVKTSDAASFFTGMMSTALGEHDLLVAVDVPVSPKGQGQAYVKFMHPASRYAVVGVAAALTASGGTCTAAAVALGGLVPRATRAAAVEKALTGQKLSADAIARAAAEVSRSLGGDILGDLYASAEYRQAVAPVWVKRALTAAADRAK